MNCLRLLLYCTFLFISPANVKSRVISLYLNKSTQYESIIVFRKNVRDYHENLFKFYSSKPLYQDIQGKIDKNVDYYAVIALGFPTQENIRVNFDTSFSSFWVPSVFCCISKTNFYKKYYGEYVSLNYEQDLINGIPQQRIIMFKVNESTQLEEEKFAGLLGFDSLWMSETEIPEVHFLEAVRMPTEPFRDVNADGVFGFGFPSESLKMTPPFFTILDRGILDSPEVSLFIGKKTQRGEIRFGGRNNEYFNKDSLYFHKLRSTGNWSINIDSILLEGENYCPLFCVASIDTGTALIAAPIESLKSIYRTLDLNYTGDVAEVNCRTRWKMPKLTITINEQVFVMNGNDYTIQINDTCALAIMESPKSDLWILGNVFLSTVYTIFDVAQLQIGFATLSELSKK